MVSPRGLAALALIVWTGTVAAGVSAQPSSPLPDQESFFAEVRKRLASNDLIQSRYSYRERSTQVRLNPFGAMGTGPELVYEVYPHPNDELTYKRLVERDGRSLAKEEIEAQDREYRERLQAWEHRVAREGSSDRVLRLRKAEEERLKDEARAREALDMFTFRLERRDTWEGQPAIIISFTPKANATPRSREGRIARAFAGQVWVHEHEFEVMNVEAKAISDVSFGFGMIGKLYHGSTATFTRQRLEGAWLPVQTTFKGTGRALMVRKMTFNYSRTYYAYQPFEPGDLPARLGWER
jgi:hypothetical protein